MTRTIVFAVIIMLIPGPVHAKTLSPDLLDQCRRFGDCTWMEGKLIPPGSSEPTVPDTCAEYDPATGNEIRRWPVVHTWLLGNFEECDAQSLPSIWWRIKLRVREMFDGQEH